MNSYNNRLHSAVLFSTVLFLAGILTACGGGGGGGGGDGGTNTPVPPPSSNAQPTISGIPPTTVTQDAPYSFTPTADDADGDTLLFTISKKPAWLSINSATGRISGTPANADVGTTTGIVISVDDQQGAANSRASLPAFNLTVNNINDAPTINGTPGTVIGVYAPYSFIPTAVDVDPTNDPLQFSIQNRPGWASFNAATGALTGTPTGSDVGMTSGIVISVTDGIIPTPVALAPFDISVRQGFNEAIFAEPTASSASVPERQYQANDGIDTVSTNGWVAANSGSGPHQIKLTFDSAKTIYRVTLKDLLGSAHVLDGTLEFSDGSSVSINGPLPDNGTPHEVVFSPRKTDWVQLTITQADNDFGIAEIAAYSLLDSGQKHVYIDLFNDANANGWTVNDSGCEKGSADWDPTFSFWSGAGNQYQQKGQCRGFSLQEGVELGTYVQQDTSFPAGMDLRLRLRSDDTGADWVKGAMGILFGYQNDNNYYRLDLSQAEGHRKLLKKQGAGVYTELNTSPQSYTPGAWTNLRVVHHNDVIQVYVNGRKVLAIEDSTFSDGKIALFCARNESCSFDNVVLLSATSAPVVGVNITDGPAHASGEYFVSTGSSLSVVATVTEITGFDRVEFVVDEGLPGEASLEDFTAPYSQTFNLLKTGDHTLRAYLLDSAGQRLAGTEAVMELPRVGIGGVHLVGLGDSITGGLRDNFMGDDTSLDGRNTSGGYESVLNDLLTADNSGKPITVMNEGNSGELSSEGVQRMAAVLARTPAAQAYLTIYGANDSGGATPTPSGLGLGPGDPGYAGSFKDNMQQMIDLAGAMGKQVILAKAPPHLTDATRNTRIQGYNQVITQLVAENRFSYTPPDFHAYFTSNPGEMADDLHPNGVGYQSMAKRWCSALNGQLGLSCSP